MQNILNIYISVISLLFLKRIQENKYNCSFKSQREIIQKISLIEQTPTKPIRLVGVNSEPLKNIKTVLLETINKLNQQKAEKKHLTTFKNIQSFISFFSSIFLYCIDCSRIIIIKKRNSSVLIYCLI